MSTAVETHVLKLVHGGDWACATRDRQALRQVCRQLASELAPPQRERVRIVERLARQDMARAIHVWAELGSSLRGPRTGQRTDS